MSRRPGNEKRNFFVEYILPVLFPVLLLGLWEWVSVSRIVSPAILPPPSRIFTTFCSLLAKGDVARHMSASLYRVLSGFVLGSLAGLVLGILVGLSHKIDKATGLIINVLRPIPVIALIPLFIIWMGIDEESKIAVITVGAFWAVLMNTTYGIKGADKKLIELAYVLKKNRLETLFMIILPSALPSIFSGIRLGIGNAWACVVAAEMIAASSGVGFLVMFAREVSQSDVMMVGILLIGIFGLLIDSVLVMIQKRFLRWGALGTDKKNG